MESITHKTGDTLSLSCTWTDSSGIPINLTGYTITSQVRSLNYTSFVDNLTVVITSSVLGTFTVSATATATALWPITSGDFNKLFCDIQFSKSGAVVSSETFEIIVVRDVTQ